MCFIFEHFVQVYIEHQSVISCVVEEFYQYH